MKRIKELSWKEVVSLINQCKYHDDIRHECNNKCPLFNECLYYYTGDSSSLYEGE